MTKTIKRDPAYLSSMFFILLSVIISGCSVIGLTIGAAEDSDHPERIDRPKTDIRQTRQGAMVQVELISGDTLTGKYIGTGQMSQPEYEAVFADLDNKRDHLSGFPAPGDSLVVADKSGIKTTFIFNGYNRGYISVCRSGENNPIAYLTRNITDIASENGKPVSGVDLESNIENGTLPTYQTAILDIGKMRRTVPSDSVTRITEFDKNNRKWKGLAIGAVIDLALLSWFIYAFSHWEWNS